MKNKPPKFKKDDIVIIARDNLKDYGIFLGEIAKILFISNTFLGKRKYWVEPIKNNKSKTSFLVFEDDCDLDNINVLK